MNTAGVSASASRPVVWVRANRIEIDGVSADLASIVARCRVAGAAEVHATGDATTRVVRDLLALLRAAGVEVYVTPDLASLVPAEPAR